MVARVATDDLAHGVGVGLEERGRCSRRGRDTQRVSVAPGVFRGQIANFSLDSYLKHALLALQPAGINRPDLLQRLGGYPPPLGAPETMGLEVAGEVIQSATGYDHKRAPVFERDGRRVPHDVSVLGFDDNQVARLLTPPVSTYRWPVSELVALVVERTVRAIDHDKRSKRKVLTATPQMRGSVAPPRLRPARRAAAE